MRKSDKKTDNELRKFLTSLCDSEFESIPDFSWLTHSVNYSNFPASLKIVCVFETNNGLNQFLNSQEAQGIVVKALNGINKLGIKLKNKDNVFVYDSEENCDSEHQGNWAKRLAKL